MHATRPVALDHGHGIPNTLQDARTARVRTLRVCQDRNLARAAFTKSDHIRAANFLGRSLSQH